jgi:hypothetical protein
VERHAAPAGDVGPIPAGDERVAIAQTTATLLVLLIVATFFYDETGLRRVSTHTPEARSYLRSTTKAIVALYGFVLVVAFSLVMLDPGAGSYPASCRIPLSYGVGALSVNTQAPDSKRSRMSASRSTMCDLSCEPMTAGTQGSKARGRSVS